MASKKRIRAQRREGAAMLIVMMMLLASTATAMFAVHATTQESRIAGLYRQYMQTQYVAESAMTSALVTVDVMGPASLLAAMDQSTPPSMAGLEPDLLPNKDGYRMVFDDFSSYASSMPIETGAGGEEPSFGNGNAYTPTFVVDINDHYTYSGVVAGHRSDGYGVLQYLLATYTARGRMQSAYGDYYVTTGGDTRAWHESAVDFRAIALSGPFGR